MSDSGAHIELSSEGGAAGDLTRAADSPLCVGSATAAEFNQIQLPPIPIACWRIDDLRFNSGTSFPLPEVAAEIDLLAKLREKHQRTPPGTWPPLSIFGHADPAGDDEQNKQMSGRRATAIYALLTRNADLWEQLFSQAADTDTWGDDSIQAMTAALGLSPQTAGQTDAQSRSQMFLAYMDKVCGDLKLDPANDFIGGGADNGGKAERQGCGGFNPVLLFSQKESDDLAANNNQQRRIAESAPNRRVIALLFQPGTRVVPELWPCPRVTENSTGCKARFWTDGEKRRTTLQPDAQRKYEATHDTFACRFYQRLNATSPCEAGLAVFRIRLFDRFGRPLPGAPFKVTANGAQLAAGKADANGDIIVRNVTVPVSCKVSWSRPPRDPFPIAYADASEDS